MLKIQFKDKHRGPIWVVDNPFNIGASSDSHLILNNEGIAQKHASLVTLNNKLYFKALETSPTCTLNNHPINVAEILPGDTIAIGNTELLVLHPHESISQPALPDNLIPRWTLTPSNQWPTNNQAIPIEKERVIIGRDSRCDITIPGSHLSRQHAEISIKGNQLHILDLSSSNGTYLNNKKITEAIATHGDEIRFDIYTFQVNSPNTDHNKTRAREEETIKSEHGANQATSSEKTKLWKTKPTSPGNREDNRARKNSNLTFIISLVLCVSMLAALVYLGLI